MTQGVVPPPPPLPSLQVVGVTAYGSTGSATSIPPSIAVLPAGTLLRGNIVSRNPLGQFILKTEKGDLALKTDVTFKRGAELVIRMEKSQNETLARIISVDGKSFAKYVESLSQQLPPEDSIAENAFTRQQAAPPPKTEIPLPGKPPLMPPPPLPMGASNVSARMTAIMLSALPQGSDALKSLPPQVAQMLTQTVAGTQLAVKVTQIVLPTAIAPAPSMTAASLPPGETAPQTTALPAPMPGASLSHPPQTTMPQPASPSLLPPLTAPPSPQSNAAPDTPFVATATPATTHPTASPVPTPTASVPSPPPSVQTAPNTPPLSAQTAVASPTLPPTSTPSPIPAPLASAITASPQTPVSTPVSQAAAQTLSAATALLPTTDSAKPLSVPLHTTAPPASGTFTQPMAARPVITATVLEGSASTGLTLHSPLGALRLLSPNPLPPGTQVHFEIEYFQPPSTHATPIPGALTATKSATLLEALQHLPLPTAAPAASLETPNPFSPHLLPRPGKEMTTELVFLMSALKGGDIRKWLGEDNIRKLEAKDTELLKQLSTEFSGMRSRLGEDGDPTVSRWTMYQLPVATQAGVMEPIRFYHREQGERQPEGDEKKGESGQHFIVDIQFTRLGRLQLDGFVKKENGAKQRFDLIIRSEHTLESDLKQGIREIFENSGEITGYDGAVSFQEGRDALFALPRPSAPNTAEEGGQSIVV